MRYWWLLLLLPLLPIAACIGIGFLAFNFATAPMDAAVEALNADVEIVEQIGKPIEAQTNGFNISDFQYENGNGNADIEFNVRGPDGTARVEGKMKAIAGTWSPDGLTVTVDDGTEYKLPRE